MSEIIKLILITGFFLTLAIILTIIYYKRSGKKDDLYEMVVTFKGYAVIAIIIMILFMWALKSLNIL